ncbi:hypothetical protein EDD11_007613 [Mortierella claussenii]|nr:hypothetical protein EDD11_007613 [Mortierella claussenii]
MPTTATTEGMKDDIEAEKTSTISRSGQENQEQLTDEFGREISPVPEVAAVVSNTDDPSIPCMTFRFWAMGLVSILALSFVNQIESEH